MGWTPPVRLRGPAATGVGVSRRGSYLAVLFLALGSLLGKPTRMLPAYGITNDPGRE